MESDGDKATAIGCPSETVSFEDFLGLRWVLMVQVPVQLNGRPEFMN